ncbi:MAG: hypothetical protein ACI8T1_004446 [Verrucomicrobiales bacterium]|jgi:hypothetical protein
MAAITVLIVVLLAWSLAVLLVLGSAVWGILIIPVAHIWAVVDAANYDPGKAAPKSFRIS